MTELLSCVYVCRYTDEEAYKGMSIGIVMLYRAHLASSSLSSSKNVPQASTICRSYVYENHYQNSFFHSHLPQKPRYEYCRVDVLLIMCLFTIITFFKLIFYYFYYNYYFFGYTDFTLPTPLMNLTGNLFNHHTV